MTRSKTTGAKGSSGGGGLGLDIALGPRWQAAASAAVKSGAAAAMSMRSQPGAWAGEKGARVATAALSAAAMDALAGRKAGGGSGGWGGREEKERGGGGGERRKSGVEGLGGALGGILLDQIARRGSKKEKKR